MTRQAPNRFLHVANGTSTTRLIQTAGIPGAWSIWADPLHDGPVPEGLEDEELLDVRMRHLAGLAHASLDPLNDMREWRATVERRESYDELILWFEHDLFDQLNLVQLLSWIRERLPPITPVSLVCIGSFPGYPGFTGLGELRPDELASLLDARQRVSEPQYALANQVWQAFRQSTPEALSLTLRGDGSALPYLPGAVTRLLQEYPWTADGLSRTERRLLEIAGAGGIDLASALRLMHEGETAYYITDTSLAEMAVELSRASPPLLVLAPEITWGERGLEGTVMLTEMGRAVLAGQLDKVDACGIDRWIGGVHLRSGGALWRWDETRRRVVHA